MDEFTKLPEDDFMYDRVDFNFLVEINMLLHFVKLAAGRVQTGQKNHINCEVFLVLKNLVNNHLPSLNEKIVSTEKSKKDLDAIFEKNRKEIAKKVEEELKKTLKPVNKPKILLPNA